MSDGAAWEYQVVWLSRSRPQSKPPPMPEPEDSIPGDEEYSKWSQSQSISDADHWWNQTLAAFKERTDKLNELGAEGWELVGLCEDLDDHIGRDEKNLRQGAAYIFKRRKIVS